MARLRRWCERVLLAVVLCGVIVGLCVAYSVFVEPRWIKVRQVRLSAAPTVRVIHLSDIHHKGDRAYLERVVTLVNDTPADLVCFTGDLVEDREHLDECLAILVRLNKPLFGIPGNHDQWAHLPWDTIRAAFRETGGDWLVDTDATALDGRLALCTRWDVSMPAAAKRVLLTHYPAAVDAIRGVTFDAILAGHTHGGQVRLPFVGHLVVPYNVGDYDVGLFHTSAGPLYVSPGIGTFFLDVRFGCRPEIGVIEM